MTSVNGATIVTTSCCGGRYKNRNYASINGRNWHVWSDGFAMGDLYEPPHAVCHCLCGGLFLRDTTVAVAYISYTSARDELDEQWQQLNALPWLPELTKALAFAVVQGGTLPTDEAIAREIRLIYWHLLNDRYRGMLGRLAKRVASVEDLAWSGFSDDVTDNLIRANLRELVPLLNEGEHMLRGEACRALGVNDKAIASFRQAMSGTDPDSSTDSPTESDHGRACLHLIQLAMAGEQRVIRLEPPDWSEPPRKPEPRINCNAWGTVVEITSSDYWFKILGMLQQVWALVEPCKDGPGVLLYRICDDSSVIDARWYETEEVADDYLRLEGWDRFDEEQDVWSFLSPPGGIFYMATSNGT